LSVEKQRRKECKSKLECGKEGIQKIASVWKGCEERNEKS
jgi:hypothetical protein